jgi:hypothetical protein
MIPPLDSEGKLPPGIHVAEWSEVESRFANSPYRAQLFEGLQTAATVLRAAGCARVYLDGSFVTSKLVPGDFDALWETTGVDVAILLSMEPCFGDFTNGRAAQKARFGGEFFPADLPELGSGRIFLDFFQTDRETGNLKGIVAIDL